ncbi:MAG: sulfatase [Thermoanaerobaculia bacterium]
MPCEPLDTPSRDLPGTAPPGSGSVPELALRRVPIPALALVLALAFVGCGGPGAGPPNVLLVSIDTLRQDHVSAYGYGRETTPALDRLADDGVVFLDARSTSSWTLPAHASVMTGRYPFEIGVETSEDALGPDVPVLAERFAGAGFATAGFASHVFLDASYGFDRGFGTYEVVPDRRAGDLTDRALAWLARERRPFFLFLHYFDPHWNYDPPDGYAERFTAGPIDRSWGRLGKLLPFVGPDRQIPADGIEQLRALYDGEIRYADDQLGRLIEGLRSRGELERTVVAVFSDHGEELEEHGYFGHGGTLYGEAVRVPLILHGPGRLPAGRRVTGAVSLRGVPEALLTLAGLEAPPEMLERPGLLAALEGRLPAEVFASTSRLGPRRAGIVAGHLKLVTPGTFTVSYPKEGGGTAGERTVSVPGGLFDLDRDPGEHAPLPAEHQAAAGLRRLLDRRLAGAGSIEAPGVDLSPEEEEALRALGYLD